MIAKDILQVTGFIFPITLLAQGIYIEGDFLSFKEGQLEPDIHHPIRLASSFDGTEQYFDCVPCLTGENFDGSPMFEWVRGYSEDGFYIEMTQFVDGTESPEELENFQDQFSVYFVGQEKNGVLALGSEASGLVFLPQFIEVSDLEISLLDLVTAEDPLSLFEEIVDFERSDGFIKIEFACSIYEVYYEEGMGFPISPKRIVERRNTCKEKGVLLGESFWDAPKAFVTEFGEIVFPTVFSKEWRIDGKVVSRYEFRLRNLDLKAEMLPPFPRPRLEDAQSIRRY